MLVIGPSGAGKSTLVDSFVNYVMGIEFYDKVRYKLINDNEVQELRKAEYIKKHGKSGTDDWEEKAQAHS